MKKSIIVDLDKLPAVVCRKVGNEIMAKTICVWLLAFLALGSTVPVPEADTKASPLNQEDLLNIIRDADPSDNDIGALPTKPPTPTAESEIGDQDKAEINNPEAPEPVKEVSTDTETQVPQESVSSAVEEIKSTSEDSPEPMGEEIISEVKNESDVSVNQTALQSESSVVVDEVQDNVNTPAQLPEFEVDELHPVKGGPIPGDEMQVPEILDDEMQVRIDTVTPEPIVFFWEESEQPAPLIGEVSDTEDEQVEEEIFPVNDEYMSPDPYGQFEPENEFAAPPEESIPVWPLTEEISPFEGEDEEEPYLLPVNDEMPFIENEQVIPETEENPSLVYVFDDQPVDDERIIIVDTEEEVPFEEEKLDMTETEGQIQDEDEELVPIIEEQLSFTQNDKITQILGDKVTIKNIEPIYTNPDFLPEEGDDILPPMNGDEQLVPVNVEEPLNPEEIVIVKLEDSEQVDMLGEPVEIPFTEESDSFGEPFPEEQVISEFDDRESDVALPIPEFTDDEMPQMEPAGEQEAPVYFDTQGNIDSFDAVPVIAEDPVIISMLVPSFDNIPMAQPVDYTREDYFIPEDNLTVEDTFNDSGMPEILRIPVGQENDSIFMSDRVPVEQENDSIFMSDSESLDDQGMTEMDQEPTMNDGFINIPGFVPPEEDVPAEGDAFQDDVVLTDPQLFRIESDEPVIEIIQTEIFTPQQIPLGAGVPLPLEDDDNTFFSVDSDDNLDENEQIVPDDEILSVTDIEGETYMPSGIPITFPEDMPPQHNLPVFPHQWGEDDIYPPSNGGDIYPKAPSTVDSFIQSDDSSYSQYNPSAVESYFYGPLAGQSYGPPSSVTPYFTPQRFPSYENDQEDETPQQPFIMGQQDYMTDMPNEDMEPQIQDMLGNQGMPLNEESNNFNSNDNTYQNSGFPIASQGFNGMGVSRTPSLQEIIMQHDYRGPNTFPLNIRNPYVVYDTFFTGPQAQSHVHRDETYDLRIPFSPYDMYQGVRFNNRYPITSQPNSFGSYQKFPFGYSPYSGDNSFQNAGLYPQRPLNRYSYGNQYDDFHPYGYPTPTW